MVGTLIPVEIRNFSFLGRVHNGSGTTQPRMHWIPGRFHRWSNGKRHEAYCLRPSSAWVKNGGAVLTTPPPPVRVHDLVLNQLSTEKTLSVMNRMLREATVCYSPIPCQQLNSWLPRMRGANVTESYSLYKAGIGNNYMLLPWKLFEVIWNNFFLLWKCKVII
jgi:hypothetical protein